MKPSLLIGSSKASLNIAYAAQENLESVAEVTVWVQGIFKRINKIVRVSH